MGNAGRRLTRIPSGRDCTPQRWWRMNWLSPWKHYWSTEQFEPRYEGEKPLSFGHTGTSCRRSDANRKTHVSWRARSLKYRGILPNTCKMIGNQSQIPSHTFPVTKAWNRKGWQALAMLSQSDAQRSKIKISCTNFSLFSLLTSKVTLHKNTTHNHKTWPKKKRSLPKPRIELLSC